MTEEECLRRFGSSPAPEQREEIRAVLEAETQRERQGQGGGDTQVMRLCCFLLFRAGLLEDVPRIWRAKTSSMDADASIDLQLLCGAGLARTKRYLRELGSDEAEAATRRLITNEVSGELDGFSVDEYVASQEAYYGGDEG
ncbi:hypothetical protein [Archangium sp.]|uniref:hypothetical protein n=1 Tax=Archangium sp. TaxID=1872627 RepID=UPI00286A85B6|nr:hypothetical protein [Archangium sp.]